MPPAIALPCSGRYRPKTQRAVQLESALETQRAFWKFIGVMTAIGIVVSVAGVVAAIAIPSFLAARGGVQP